ncbi:MAG: tRNA (adenosine(37)-N6)-threonylcarbamoyltransferase complex ATPase subunit type 1 TsaE [Candidatus Paceibacterota bacterium]
MERTYSESDIEGIAEEVLGLLSPSDVEATVLALQGDLGAGKTTLTKTLAVQLGVSETVVSPTFVIAKFYTPTKQGFEHLVHIDAYRIEDLNELRPLGWEKILQQPKTLVIVEWPEKITPALPANKKHLLITHNRDQRTIKKL